ncbi:hypothetical protein Q0Z83_088270 [Actinoplanes sichuanensis]|nr:hypothetical protein Q0Z83_088270 [Actinoplanes sichuanensis]
MPPASVRYEAPINKPPEHFRFVTQPIRQRPDPGGLTNTQLPRAANSVVITRHGLHPSPIMDSVRQPLRDITRHGTPLPPTVTTQLPHPPQNSVTTRRATPGVTSRATPAAVSV